MLDPIEGGGGRGGGEMSIESVRGTLRQSRPFRNRNDEVVDQRARTTRASPKLTTTGMHFSSLDGAEGFLRP